MEQALISAGIGAIVLAGGQSRRLGFDKALVRIDGQPLVRWLPTRLRALFSPVVVVTDRPGRYAVPYPLVVDGVPDAGPLAGIAAGMEALAGKAAFICACDMPLLDLALLRQLAGALAGHDLAIPERAGRLEPLCAVYSPNCLPVIRRLLAERRLRVNGVAAEVRTHVLAEAEWRALDPSGDSFLSINTPEDLTRLQERAGRRGYRLQRETSPPC